MIWSTYPWSIRLRIVLPWEQIGLLGNGHQHFYHTNCSFEQDLNTGTVGTHVYAYSLPQDQSVCCHSTEDTFKQQ